MTPNTPDGSYPHTSRIIVVDCGSTTSKAVLIARQDDRFRVVGQAEAATTVELPTEDVTVGIRNALDELEKTTGEQITSRVDPEAANGQLRDRDLFLATSSAGGGLRVAVVGVIREMTADSAEKAALGAGAVVTDVVAMNDRRPRHEQISQLRQSRPDIILLCGGTDGGSVEQVKKMAELVRDASVAPRGGAPVEMPVIFAGNQAAREEVSQTLGTVTKLIISENVRPTLESENFGPARHQILEAFLEHVMTRAPGYDRLAHWTHDPILPTPAAAGNSVLELAREQRSNMLSVDLGGATTDVFLVHGDQLIRSVSANLGMSYSAAEVVRCAGLERVMRWTPKGMSATELMDRVGNKVLRPTTIPETVRDLQVEQALAREALRAALRNHRRLLRDLKGTRAPRTISDAFAKDPEDDVLWDRASPTFILASGGAFSRSPDLPGAFDVIADGIQPKGITRVARDPHFVLPHAGVLGVAHMGVARDIRTYDALSYLGTIVSPWKKGRRGRIALEMELIGNDGVRHTAEIRWGERRKLDTGEGPFVLKVNPDRSGDLGAGPGRSLERRVAGGPGGILFDCRNSGESS